MVTVNGRIQVRRGTVAEFGEVDPVLAFGELAVASTEQGGTVVRIGDGTRPWSALTGLDPEVLAQALTALVGRVTTVEESADELAGVVSTLGGRVTDVEGNVESLGSDLSAVSGDLAAVVQQLAEKVDADALAPVATSGVYGDLTGRPTIPQDADDVGALPRPVYLQVYDGDSLTRGSGSTYGRNYPTQAIEGIDATTITYNFGVSGQGIGQMAQDAATQIDPLFNPSLVCVLHALGGTNDLAASNVGGNPAAIYATTRDYHLARRAAGFSTVVYTILPRTGTTNDALFEQKRQELNTLIRNGWQGFASQLADIGADAVIGAAGASTNLTYYTDGTHLTNAGYAIMARYARAANRALGVAGAHDHTGYALAPRTLWLPATSFTQLAGGGCTLTAQNLVPVWSLPKSGTNVYVVGSFRPPRDWASFRFTVVWINLSSGAGDVRWNEYLQPISIGTPVSSGWTQWGGTFTAGAQNTPTTQTPYGTGQTDVNATADHYAVRVDRLNTNAADTLAGAIGLVGVRVDQYVP